MEVGLTVNLIARYLDESRLEMEGGETAVLCQMGTGGQGPLTYREDKEGARTINEGDTVLPRLHYRVWGRL